MNAAGCGDYSAARETSLTMIFGGDMTAGIFKLIHRTLLTFTMSLAVLGGLLFTSTAIAQSEDANSRQIVLDRFNKARPV